MVRRRRVPALRRNPRARDPGPDGRAQTSSRRCGKLRYTTHAAALMAATLRAEQDPSYPGDLRVYECPLCLGWHITSQPQRSA